MSTNPLVAQAHDSTTWYTGLGLVEDAADITNGIRNNSWVDTTLGTVGASLDILGMALDPIGSLVSWGVSWLMEHVKPLKDALDWLAGSPDEISAHASTWQNVSSHTSQACQRYAAAIDSQITAWTGPSGEAYRQHAQTHLAVMRGIANAASGISCGVQGAGLLVGLVRGIVRDLISQFVATLAARLPQWLAEAGLTLGAATPVVIGQVSSLVATWVNKIQKFIRALLNSMRRLKPLLARLSDVLTSLKGLLARLSRSTPLRGADTPGTPRGRGSPGGNSLGDPPGDPTMWPDDLDLDPVDLTPRPLTDGDRFALHDYTTNDGYQTMNPYLRDPGQYSDVDAAAIQARADRVSDGLAKLPAEPGTTYRGVTYSDDVLGKYEPGQIVTEHAFTSTSRDPNVAKGAFDGNTVMVIEGRNGRDVAPFSQYGHEAEILYDKATNFQVTSKYWDASIGKWVVTMEEV